MDLNRVHEFAERHFGLTTRSALRELELSDRQVTRLVERGFLLPVHRAVYRLPGSARSIEQHAYAAYLALSDQAFVSHLTAAGVWGLASRIEKPEVMIPWHRRSRLPTVVVRRSSYLDRGEVTRKGIIPVTRVARTLSDLQPRLPGDDLEEALDEALRRRLVTSAQLAKYPRLRKLAEDRMKHGVPGSKLERLAIDALRRVGLPEPVRQYKVRIRGRTYYPDLSYPDRKIAIELEGQRPHWNQWQYDHDRDNDFELDGWRVLTYTWEDANTGSLKLVLQVGEILRLRPTRWTAR